MTIKAARRRDIPLHLRLMACTAIIPLEAALERTYIYGTPNLVPNFDVALYASVVTLIVLTAVLPSPMSIVWITQSPLSTKVAASVSER